MGKHDSDFMNQIDPDGKLALVDQSENEASDLTPTGVYATPEEVYEHKKAQVIRWLEIMLELRDGKTDTVVFYRAENGCIRSGSYVTQDQEENK
jgi:hypothetical protein